MDKTQKSQEGTLKKSTSLTSMKLIQMRGLVDPDKQLGFRTARRIPQISTQRTLKSPNSIKQKSNTKETKERREIARDEYLIDKNKMVIEQYGCRKNRQPTNSAKTINLMTKGPSEFQKQIQMKHQIFNEEETKFMLKLKLMKILENLGMNNTKLNKVQVGQQDSILQEFTKEVKKNIKIYQESISKHQKLLKSEKEILEKELLQNQSLKHHISELKNHESILYNKISELQVVISSSQKKSKNLKYSKRSSNGTLNSDDDFLKKITGKEEQYFQKTDELKQQINIEMELSSLYSFLEYSESDTIRNSRNENKNESQDKNKNVKKKNKFEEDDFLTISKDELANFINSLKKDLKNEEMSRRKVYLKNFANQWKQYTKKLIQSYQKQLKEKNKLLSHFYKGKQKKQ